MDNDADVTISPATLTVDEGGASQEYTVVLGTAPTGDVTIAYHPNLTLDMKVGPTNPPQLFLAFHTFTPTNWNTPLRVFVRATDDAEFEGSETHDILHSIITTADTNYPDTAAISSVTVTVTDNDTAGVTVSKTAVTVSEDGATDSYTIRLDSEPTADVIISVTSGDTRNVTVSPAMLTFTDSNWDDNQTVTVRAVNDDVDDGDNETTITHSSSSSDPNYFTSLSIADVTATATDNDTAGVIIMPTAVNVTEAAGAGRTAEYTVRLTSQPRAVVTVAIGGLAQFDFVVNPSTLFFGPRNWDTVKIVTVTANDDDIDEGDAETRVITHTVSGADYNVMAPDVTITIADDDTSGVTIMPTTITVTEAGGPNHSTQYSVVLNSKPDSRRVTVTPGGQNALDFLADFVVNPGILHFSDTNWGTAKIVTVTARDDAIDEGDTETKVITHTVFGGGFSSDAAPDVTVNITDDDTRGVTISPTTVTVTEEAGRSNRATYRVWLTSGPSSGFVTVTFGGHEGGDFVIHPNTLVFTDRNWGSQVVTVTATDDAFDEDDLEMHTITHTVSGADYGSNNVMAPDVTVVITDDYNPPGTVITTDSATHRAFNIDENTATSVVIKTYESTNRGRLTWTLEGDDRADFTITINAFGHGELRFARVPNYEMAADAGADNVYDVRVRVTDSDTSTDSLLVRVTVDDVNEAPTITGRYRPSVPENSTAVITLSATDEDASDTLTWSVERWDDGGKFTIDPSSGALSFTSAPDFETPTDIGDTAMNNTYVVTVKVSDARGLVDTHPIWSR